MSGTIDEAQAKVDKAWEKAVKAQARANKTKVGIDKAQDKANKAWAEWRKARAERGE